MLKWTRRTAPTRVDTARHRERPARVPEVQEFLLERAASVREDEKIALGHTQTALRRVFSFAGGL